MFMKLASLHKEHRQLQQNRPSYLFSILSASLVAHVKKILELFNLARISIKQNGPKLFGPEAYPAQTFFKPSVPGDLRVFRAFASLFLTTQKTLLGVKFYVR